MMMLRLMTRPVLYMMLASLLMACIDKEHGQCAAPNETVSWHWMKETGCSCSYPAAGWEEPEPCKAGICSDDPSTNDPVQFGHGAWKRIEPELAVDMSLLPEGENVVVADVGH